MPTKTLLTKLATLKKKKDDLDAQIKQIEAEKANELRKERHEKGRIIGMAMLRLVDSGSWTEEQLIELVSPFITSGKERRFLGLVPPKDKLDTAGKKKASSKLEAKAPKGKRSVSGSKKSASKIKAAPLSEPSSEDALMNEFNL